MFILLKGCCLTTYWSFALLLLFLNCTNVLATEVRRAEITLQGNSYILSADIDYRLSEKADEALQNGVPLFWILHVKVIQQRHYLWDKILVELTMRYRIQYHALLNMYRVKNEYSGAIDNFSTLSAALDWMSTIRNVPILERYEIAPQKHYVTAIKVNFDRDALPLPLRPVAYINPQWYLSSDWTVWPLKK
ncbi:MAG: DUF4390 domain-containing protein [Methylococcaceae bacterium]